MHAFRFARFRMFVLLASLCFAVYAGGALKQGPSELQLKVNDVHLPVFFEDPTLTDSEKKVIVADYQLLMNELGPIGRYPSGPRQIQRDGSAIRITSTFGYSARHLKRPNGFEREFGVIGKSSDEQEYIVIGKKLSDGYKAAMALKEDHEDACLSLPDFIALMNNLDKAKVPAPKDFFYLPGDLKQHREGLASVPKQKIIEEYEGFRYTWGSMLELRMYEGKLMTIVYAMNKNDSHVYGRPVIYDEGRWKMFFVRYGT